MKQAVREYKLNEGNVPKVMNVQNPAEQRRLTRQLSKLEDEKKKRESALTWTQRSFFMKQVFDQDKELRFVKAQQRPKYKPPKINSKPYHIDPFLDNNNIINPNELDIGENEDISRVAEEEKPPSRPSSGSNLKTEGTLPPIEQPSSVSNEDSNAARTPKDIFSANVNKLRSISNDRPMFMRVVSIYASKNKHLFEENKGNEENAKEKNPDETNEKGLPEDEPDKADEIKEEPDEADTFTSPKKTKFPVLKVKALGLFAAAMNRAPIDPQKSSMPSLPSAAPGRKSVSLPNSPTIKRKGLSARRCSAKSLEGRPHLSNKNVQSENNVTDLQTGINSFKQSKRKTHTASRSDSKTVISLRRPSVFKQSNRTRTATATNAGEANDPQKNIWQRVTSLPEEPSVHIWNKDRTKENHQEQMGVVDIEDCEQEFVQEIVLRRLVKTLPTDMLVKSVNREKEAGGISTGEVKRKMLEKAKHKMSRRVVLDDRFKRLEKTLAET